MGDAQGQTTFAAISERIQRELDLLKGWRPTAKPRTESASKVKMLDAAMDEYLAEIEAGRKPKTLCAYKVSLRYFYECVGNKPLNQINRGDLLDFPVFLREEKKQAPDHWNKFENVMTFLNTTTSRVRRSKSERTTGRSSSRKSRKFMSRKSSTSFSPDAMSDELLLFEFFLMTGMREQEVIYATDRCLAFDTCTVSVRHNPTHGWTPKMYKERTIPVPAALMAKLKKMLVDRGKGGLLFPTKNGQPKFDFLDMAKAYCPPRRNPGIRSLAP